MSFFCLIPLALQKQESLGVPAALLCAGDSHRHYLILSSKMDITNSIFFPPDEETEVHGGQIT